MNLDIVQNESSPAQEAIALLIDMAKNGEIDPWDVQVIDVIDRCLEKLEQFWSTQTQNFEVNLSQSGQAFLYASMLVLLKADTLS
ncbi:MAG TPA: segregation/condensation protein A, partial [Allocoleopsis sp.]